MKYSIPDMNLDALLERTRGLRPMIALDDRLWSTSMAAEVVYYRGRR